MAIRGITIASLTLKSFNCASLHNSLKGMRTQSVNLQGKTQRGWLVFCVTSSPFTQAPLFGIDINAMCRLRRMAAPITLY